MVEFDIDLSTSLKLYDEFEPIVYYTGELIELDENEDRLGEIGWFRMTHIMECRSHLLENGTDVDLHSVETVLRSIDEYSDMWPLNVWYMDRLLIDPKYRGRGVGSNFIYRMMSHVSLAASIGAFIVCALPLDDFGIPILYSNNGSHDYLNERLSSLKRFYSKLGLNQVLMPPNGDFRGQHWFYYNLEYRLPDPPVTW